MFKLPEGIGYTVCQFVFDLIVTLCFVLAIMMLATHEWV